MRVRLIALTILAVGMLALAASCAYRPEVVGRWQRVDGPDTLEFREDGTFTTVDNMGANAMGRYTLHADGTLYYAVTHTNAMQARLVPVEDFQVRVAGVTFRRRHVEIKVMTDEGQAVEVYRRAD